MSIVGCLTLKNNAMTTFSKMRYILAATTLAVITSCSHEITAPSQGELFAEIPAESATLLAVNLDSCTFAREIVADCLYDYLSLTDAVIFTADSEQHEPVMMLRATDPVVVGQSAYDWMQVPFETDDGQQLLSMSTGGGITTFTDSRFVWVMRADNAKKVMAAVLTAPKSKAAAAAFRIADGKLRDAASGRIRFDDNDLPIVAHVHDNVLRLVTGVNIDNDTVRTADKPSPGINARVDGATAVQLISRLTSGLSMTHRMAVNALSSFVEKAQVVNVQASPTEGVSIEMYFDTADGDAAHIAKTLNDLASSGGFNGLITTTAGNGVQAGPVKIEFDCRATIGIVQMSGKDLPPSFTIDIAVPDGLSALLQTAPFDHIMP